MSYDISGTVMQTLSIVLEPGEVVVSQTHAMAWMTDAIEMDTHTGGGLFAGLKRAFGGGSFFITEYGARSRGEVAFAPRFPGQIIPMKLGAGEAIICRKETFLCAERTVGLDIVLQQRLGAGVFAGEGFILQRVTGPGTVWLDLSGEVIEKTLGPGERLRVHAGHIGMQEPTVATDIQNGDAKVVIPKASRRGAISPEAAKARGLKAAESRARNRSAPSVNEAELEATSQAVEDTAVAVQEAGSRRAISPEAAKARGAKASASRAHNKAAKVAAAS